MLFFFEGGIGLVLRVWEEDVSAEGYKLRGVATGILGILVGSTFGDWLAPAVLRRTGLRTEEQIEAGQGPKELMRSEQYFPAWLYKVSESDTAPDSFT
jgi:hypothetical protein